ncbi:MAG TPA: CHAD domain-containing protein [Terriglobales bacterium]|jgi:CHAD domain-containing protein|nr:CHAD domain-containing protein [Terriglobales bacterium]
MPVDQERSRLAFKRLDRQLSKLAKRPAPESVHRFRTYGRRVEAMLNELVVEPSRNDRKLLKLLSRLRKKAGRVRDLDVQIVSLRNLRIPQEPERKAQLLRTLGEERSEREKKLAKAFDAETISQLRKRLKRAGNGAGIPENIDPLSLAMRQLAQLGHDHAPLTEKILHQYRIVGKRARYLAELAGKNPEAERFVAQLKRMQDVLGDWHDWLKLTQRAEELFGRVQDSALVAALHNVTGAKFRRSVEVLTETRAALAKKPVTREAASRKAARLPSMDTEMAVA